MEMVGISPTEDHHLPWHRDVYRKHEGEAYADADAWIALRDACFARDQGCVRCNVRPRNINRHLTAHHITPRSDGGINDLVNLVTLCNECHDFVELNNLRTLADITCIDDAPIKKAKLKPIRDRVETFERPDWHAWVYGGDKGARELRRLERLEGQEQEMA